MNRIMLLMTCLFFAGCTDQVKEPVVKNELGKNGSFIERDFLHADSAEFIFYLDPYDEPTRFSRNYNYTSTSDPAIISVLRKQLQMEFEMAGEKDSCRSQGKVYVFSGGRPVKTIYFTAAPGCRRLYFIKNGAFYSAALHPLFAATLQEVKKEAEVAVRK